MPAARCYCHPGTRLLHQEVLPLEPAWPWSGILTPSVSQCAGGCWKPQAFSQCSARGPGELLNILPGGCLQVALLRPGPNCPTVTRACQAPAGWGSRCRPYPRKGVKGQRWSGVDTVTQVVCTFSPFLVAPLTPWGGQPSCKSLGPR